MRLNGGWGDEETFSRKIYIHRTAKKKPKWMLLYSVRISVRTNEPNAIRPAPVVPSFSSPPKLNSFKCTEFPI